MILVFGRNSSLISRIIRLRTGSKWSHVAILDTDGNHVIEARGNHGVERNTMSHFLTRYRVVDFRYMPGDMDKARSYIGRPYDEKGIIGILFRTYDHCELGIHCSELTALASSTIPDEFAHTLTPDLIYRLSWSLDRKCKSASSQRYNN